MQEWWNSWNIWGAFQVYFRAQEPSDSLQNCFTNPTRHSSNPSDSGMGIPHSSSLPVCLSSRESLPSALPGNPRNGGEGQALEVCQEAEGENLIGWSCWGGSLLPPLHCSFKQTPPCPRSGLNFSPLLPVPRLILKKTDKLQQGEFQGDLSQIFVDFNLVVLPFY